MAKPKMTLTFDLDIKLTESEARALEALTVYGLGTAYAKPHDAGLRSLFEAIKMQVKPQLRIVDNAKKKIETALNSQD